MALSPLAGFQVTIIGRIWVTTEGNRLAEDCCALRPFDTNSAFARCTAESCRGNCHARWSRGRPDADRCGVGTWRIGKLLPGAFSPCGDVPQARQDSRGSVLS